MINHPRNSVRCLPHILFCLSDVLDDLAGDEIKASFGMARGVVPETG